MKKRYTAYPKYVRASYSWSSLSSADQLAVEYANQFLDQGYDLEDAVYEGCRVVSEGNAEPEYEGEEFYMEEPDYSSVLKYMQSR